MKREGKLEGGRKMGGERGRRRKRSVGRQERGDEE